MENGAPQEEEVWEVTLPHPRPPEPLPWAGSPPYAPGVTPGIQQGAGKWFIQ